MAVSDVGGVIASFGQVVVTSIDELCEAITTWAEHWNADPKPFIWKAS
ncbi:hypothetical protein [Nostocoides japonicum]|nr:hypothetical protein [Tetrasphaera japonica]